jgi:hypothetical protein
MICCCYTFKKVEIIDVCYYQTNDLWGLPSSVRFKVFLRGLLHSEDLSLFSSTCGPKRRS